MEKIFFWFKDKWLIHVNVWLKSLQYCKVISLQLIKINEKKINSPHSSKAIKKKILWKIPQSLKSAPVLCHHFLRSSYREYSHFLKPLTKREGCHLFVSRLVEGSMLYLETMKVYRIGLPLVQIVPRGFWEFWPSAWLPDLPLSSMAPQGPEGLATTCPSQPLRDHRPQPPSLRGSSQGSLAQNSASAAGSPAF